jgi:UDP-galactopyranose mutase
MPLLGYTEMFKNILDNPNITFELGTDFALIKDRLRYKRLIFTGPVDEYFDHCFGKLPYRSLRFDHQTIDREWFQPVAVVNYPQTENFTRITEYKHLTGQFHEKTSITYEYPTDEGDPYYPVPRAENQALYKRYEKLALERKDVWFAGRLATYQYYNMDQVVGQALSTFRRINEQIPIDRNPLTKTYLGPLNEAQLA